MLHNMHRHYKKLYTQNRTCSHALQHPSTNA